MANPYLTNYSKTSMVGAYQALQNAKFAQQDGLFQMVASGLLLWILMAFGRFR